MTVIVWLPVLPSTTCASSAETMTGSSLSTIVASPVASPIGASFASLRTTVNVSSPSSRMSPTTEISIVLLVVPAGNRTDPVRRV